MCYSHTASLFIEPQYDAEIAVVCTGVLIFGGFRQKAVKSNGNKQASMQACKQASRFCDGICEFYLHPLST